MNIPHAVPSPSLPSSHRAPHPRRTHRAFAASFVLLAIGGLPGAAAAQGSSPQERARDAAESLRDAERAFATASAVRGAKTAFLEVLAERSILFAPNAVDGRTRMENVPEFPGWLDWDPALVEVSPDGSLGYTTGPYTFTTDGEVPSEHGRYLSIWTFDGEWRVLLDIGSIEPVADVDEPVLLHHGTETLGIPVAGGSVREADERWRAQVRRDGTDAALGTLGGHRALVLRPGRAARRGSMDLRQRPIDDPAVESWVVEGGDCSMDGVLCWLHGRVRAPGARSDGNWVRIWRAHRDGGWGLALDLRQGG